MLIKDITNHLESIAPLALQENYDNCGLLVGNANDECFAALLTLDCTEEIIDEAIAIGANLVIAHHPIIFGGIKKLNGKNYVERTIIKAIKNNIAIYAAHTNYDNINNGVNEMICNKIGLTNCKILVPKPQTLQKLITYCPVNNAEMVRTSLFAAGAGNIGNYSNCSFSSEGYGTYMANENANPTAGEIGKLHTEKEVKIEVIFPFYSEQKIVEALVKSHPYEEVAYDIISISNTSNLFGSGMLGVLENELSEHDFLKQLKLTFGLQAIKHTNLLNKKIKTVAVCGGSGSFLLGHAIAANADVYVSSDFKYHEYFNAENKIVIADIGHFETEQFTPQIFYNHIIKKFSTFATHLSKVNTNPIKYFNG